MAQSVEVPHPVPPSSESHLLAEITRTHQALISRFSRKVGMSASRLALLRALGLSMEAMGIMDLARQLGINASAVTRQVQEIEEEGLVRRHADPRDGRRSYVKLSAKGAKVFDELHARGHEFERVFSSALTADEAARTTAALFKLRRFIEGM